MCEQDYEHKKLVITKFSVLNFRLSANRAFVSMLHDCKTSAER